MSTKKATAAKKKKTSTNSHNKLSGTNKGRVSRMSAKRNKAASPGCSTSTKTKKGKVSVPVKTCKELASTQKSALDKARKEIYDALDPAKRKLLDNVMSTAKRLNEMRKKLGSIYPFRELRSKDELNFLRCQGKNCDNIHFRHAGYIELALPYVKPNGKTATANNSYAVKVCVKCRKCYIFHEDHFYDVTKYIDLKAWEKAEKELHKATGPGGQC